MDCALAQEGKDATREPKRKQIMSGQGTDQIGGLVPAMPTNPTKKVASGEEPVETFWGYTSVRPESVEWWKNLPYESVIVK